MMPKMFDHQYNHPGGHKTKRCFIVAGKKWRSGKHSRQLKLEPYLFSFWNWAGHLKGRDTLE